MQFANLFPYKTAVPKGKISICYHRVANSDICLLGRKIRADIFGSQKTSQMAASVRKRKNEESSVNINNLFSNKYPISMFDLTK